MVQFVRLSHIFDNVHELFMSDYHWQRWCPCQRTRSEVKTKFNRFRTATQVWIHMWRWNDAQGLVWLRRGVLLFLAANKQFCEWFSPPVRLSHRVPAIVSSWHFKSYYQCQETSLISHASLESSNKESKSYYQWQKSMQKVMVRGQRSRS